jgi:hypothetical protein
MLASGAAEAEIVADYPYISAADVRTCLAYPASVADHPVVTAAECGFSSMRNCRQAQPTGLCVGGLS